MDLKRAVCDVDRIHLSWNRDMLRALLNTVMNFQVSYKLQS